MDFKRLLLQKSVKTVPTRLSAAEQLKLSRNAVQQDQYQLPSPKPISAIPLTKVLSPRSVWRFHTPRTDVLSSTILEDTAAEEKAMKPSPENSINAKLSPRRLLELSNKVSSKKNSEVTAINKNIVVDRRFVKLDKKEKEIENHLSSNKLLTLVQNLQKYEDDHNQNPIKAIENRRISNQLARAQFLATNSTPIVQNNKELFAKRFRARSESPQQNAQRASQNVIRSPSTPALETAL